MCTITIDQSARGDEVSMTTNLLSELEIWSLQRAMICRMILPV